MDERQPPSEQEAASDLSILESRLVWRESSRHEPWLLPDDGTEHVVDVGTDPFDAVHAVISNLAEQVAEFSAQALRSFSKKYSVFVAPPLVPCTNRDDAVAHISQSIASFIAGEHEYESESRWSVACFGSGSGIMLQEVLSDGLQYQQFCYLISRDHRLCSFFFYFR